MRLCVFLILLLNVLKSKAIHIKSAAHTQKPQQIQITAHVSFVPRVSLALSRVYCRFCGFRISQFVYRWLFFIVICLLGVVVVNRLSKIFTILFFIAVLCSTYFFTHKHTLDIVRRFFYGKKNEFDRSKMMFVCTTH